MNARSALVDVGGHERGGEGVGPRDQHGRDVEHVGRQARGGERPQELRVGIRTLPPRCPHFFSEESWSSKWTPAAPASIIAVIISKALSGPPNPASASATIGARKSSSRPRPRDLVGAPERVVDPLHDRGHGVGGVERLIGIGLAGEVRVGGHLPAREVDRLQAGLGALDGLVAGQAAERRHVVLGG